MERMKKLGELTEPDPRNLIRAKLNASAGIAEPMTVVDHYCNAAEFLESESSALQGRKFLFFWQASPGATAS